MNGTLDRCRVRALMLCAVAALALSACASVTDGAATKDAGTKQASSTHPASSAGRGAGGNGGASGTSGRGAHDAGMPQTNRADAAVSGTGGASQSQGTGGMPSKPLMTPDAGTLLDAAPAIARADAAAVACSGEHTVPCVDAVPDRTSGIGDLDVSSVPRPVCPEQLPVAGAACTQAGLKCGYGNRARFDCREIFECTSSKWVDVSPPCYATPPEHCPASAPAMQSACETIVFPEGKLPICEYGADVTCTCGQRYFRDQVSGWVCNPPPSTAGCPAVEPNFGEGCDVQGTECGYGPICQPAGGRWFCRNGVWEYAGEDPACGID